MSVQSSDLTAARITDAVNICVQRDIPRFVGFLTSSQAATAINIAKKSNAKFMLYCGYDDGERCVFGAFPDWCEPSGEMFPITAVEFIYREKDELTHRDFLGALMSLGIARETVGDILVGKGRTVVFVLNDIEKYVVSQINKIGSVGVNVSVGLNGGLPQGNGFSEHTDTVASTRLDCVVTSFAKCGRSRAAEMIESGLVAVNGIMVDKITSKICQNDKITIRGFGKFVICDCGNTSKKGRVIINYNKYL